MPNLNTVTQDIHNIFYTSLGKGHILQFTCCIRLQSECVYCLCRGLIESARFVDVISYVIFGLQFFWQHAKNLLRCFVIVFKSNLVIVLTLNS